MGIGPVTVFEGITLNRACELLYEVEGTRRERVVSSRLYLKCLEDLVFGVVFGSAVATGNIPEVLPGVLPFKDLQKEISLSVHEVDTKGLEEVELLKDPEEVDKLRALMLGLDKAVGRDFNAWKALALRELGGSLNDPALRLALEDPSAYVFAGRANFWPHAELQQLVPKRYLEQMLIVAKNNLELDSDVQDIAIRAFLSRNVLAHLLIFRRYQRGFRQLHKNTPAVHLTHATRASLVPDEPTAEWSLRSYTIPRVMLNLLDRSRDRKDFRKELGNLIASHSLNEHRTMFAEALDLQSQGRVEQAEYVITALKRLCEGEVPDNLRVANMTVGNGTPLPIAIRQNLIKNDYLFAVKSVFPELQFE